MVLKHSFNTIPALFADKEMCIMNYMSKDIKDKAIEIRFDTVTFTCLFDKNDVCDSSFLFLDDLDDLPDYVEYCNKMYDYNLMLSGWMIKDYCFRIKPSKGDFFFALLPISTTLDESKRNSRAQCLAV